MNYTFLRWLRQGIAAALDGSVLGPPKGARATVTVNVAVSATGIPNTTASTTIEVLGPCDVNGLVDGQVIRTFPVAGTLDFEPDYFAHVEFKRPDLPWLFTPLPPVTAIDTTPPPPINPPYRKQQTLPPWLCLAVVPKRKGVTLEPGIPPRLPRLKIEDNAGKELPLLEEAHAWAHVQISGDASQGAAAIAANEKDRILSRLVCPRRLEPGKSYFACLVPVFKAGRDAGVGEEITATTPGEFAWGPGDSRADLPVYFHWEFSTGGSGDFESLVRRLEKLDEIPGAGTRELDITSPSFGLDDRGTETKINLGGALRVIAAGPAPIDRQFANALPPILNAVETVAPPIYGRWHAAVDKVTTRPSGKLGWVNALNLDPRYRVAAGLGTRVVQDRQEDLMAAVWEQFGEILRANQLLRQAQLAVAASECLVARHLAPLEDLELLSVVGPALGRIRIGEKRTARKAVRESCLPLIALSGAFRRIARARGPLERRFALSRGTLPDVPVLDEKPAIDMKSLLLGLASGQLRLGPALLPDGAIAAPFEIVPRRRPPRPKGVGGGRQPLVVPSEPTVPADVLTALLRLKSRVRSGGCNALDSQQLAIAIRAAIAPGVAITTRVRAQIKLPEGITISPRLDPIMVAPEIPTPMIGPLQEFGQDWLLPGLSEVPPNSVTIVEPDPAFIEAYMVGLNHEMSRELLWRGFPTDQRGTVFSRFWDRRGSVSTETTPVPTRDINPIHKWKSNASLGSNLTSKGEDLLLLLIRGDLLQRYPGATIFMQRARWKRTAKGLIVRENDRALREPVPLPAGAKGWEADSRFPSFSGRIGADITFLGFPLSREEVCGRSQTNVPDRPELSGNAGWFVVFQEHPTEPRFGLSEGETTPPPVSAKIGSWDDLTWWWVETTVPAITSAGQQTKSSGYLKVVETSTIHQHAELSLQPAWDGRSDSLAAIVLKRAFRLFVHASDLVAE